MLIHIKELKDTIFNLWNSSRKPDYDISGINRLHMVSKKFYLTFFNVIRLIIIFAIIARFFVFNDKILFNLYVSSALFYIIYVLIFFIRIIYLYTSKDKSLSFSDRIINMQSLVDITIFTLIYIATLKIDSSLYLFFAVPILMASFKEKYNIYNEIIKCLFILMLLIISTFCISYITKETNLSFLMIMGRKIMPKLFFIGGIFLISIVLHADRKRTFEIINQYHRASNEKNAILNNIGEYIFTINNKHEILWVNSKFNEYYQIMLGKEIPCGCGALCYNIFRKRDQVCHECISDIAMKENKTCDRKEEWPDNKIYQVTASPLKDERGETIGAVETLLDISEKEKLQIIINEQSYGQKIIESSADSIIVTDKKGNMQTCNKGAINLLGYNEAEFRTLSCKQIYCNNIGVNGYVIAKAVMTGLESSDGKRIFNYMTNFKAKSGNIIPISLSASLIYDDKHEIIGVVGVARDMRELIKLEADTIKNERLAAIGGVAGFLAHTVKGDIGTLQLDMEDLYETCNPIITNEDNIRFRKCLRVLKQMDREIKDIHDASTGMHMEFQIISSRELLKKVIDEFKSVADMKGIKLKSQISKELIQISADENHLMRVFNILFLNSVDALAQKKDNAEIIICAQQDANKLSITWQDNGQGIAEDLFATIFDPFVTTKEKGKGWGIGLSIAKNIIKKHNGEICLDKANTKVSKGTCFAITIPTS
ncbi:MAG: ATP-binding protein [Thermodesulfovibrionales bacterium]